MSISVDDALILSDPQLFHMAEGGVIRVGNSRVSLDLIVEQYENGMSPEDLVRAYDGLLLADAYAAIAHYLRHPVEVQTYLARRKTESELLKSNVETQRQSVSRKELESRRPSSEKVDVAAGK